MSWCVELCGVVGNVVWYGCSCCCVCVCVVLVDLC